MQFQIPQFIETESKIIGPLTLKQFGYIAGAGLIIFLLFFTLKMIVWIFLSVIIGSLGLALAFLKYNGQKFPSILISILKYIWKPKFYIWASPKKGVISPEMKETAPKIPAIKAGQAAAVLESPARPAPVSVAPELKTVQPKPITRTAAPVKEPVLEKIKIKQKKQSVPDQAVRPKTTVLVSKKEEAKKQKQIFIKAQEEADQAAAPKKPKPGPRGLGALWLKLVITTKALTRREKKPPVAAAAADQKSKEIFEMFRKITGDREVARRVDYR